MIERKFVSEKLREFRIQEFITNSLDGAGHSHTKVQRTPLGEKVIIYASRPGLVVGRKGQNIKELTRLLKKRFKSENPQIEISEVENVNLDASIVAERIANSLERFGAKRFKSIGHKLMADVMSAGALGVELVISGKIPGARAKSWRFYSGYLKKCGDVAIEGVDKAHAIAKLKVGIVGIKVKIMPPTIVLPDKITLLEDKEEKVEEIKEEKDVKKEEVKEGKKEKKIKPKVEKKIDEVKVKEVKSGAEKEKEAPKSDVNEGKKNEGKGTKDNK